MTDFKPYHVITPDCPYYDDLSDCPNTSAATGEPFCMGCEYCALIQSEEQEKEFDDYCDSRLRWDEFDGDDS